MIPNGLIPSTSAKTRLSTLLVAFVTLSVSASVAQEIDVEPHWSKYQAPTSYPEGSTLHIIVDGDTLWDISGNYLDNPFLWPQLWDANRYIDDPHLIFPGDPVVIPDLDVVRPEDVEADETGGPGGAGGGPGGEGAEDMTGLTGGGGPGGSQGPAFYPAYEEQTIACAGYVTTGRENDDFRITGSEEGDAKVNLATSDIVYLNQGSNQGIQAGDRFFTQRRVPRGWGQDGEFVGRSGAVVILAVQSETSMAEVYATCLDIHVDDYLKPFEPIPVPLLPRQPVATRLTPATGQMQGEIIASLEQLASLGEGYLVSIDLGESAGVVPGNVFTVYRHVYEGAPRKVLGEIAILTVQSENATARIMESYDFMVVGDLVELK